MKYFVKTKKPRVTKYFARSPRKVLSALGPASPAASGMAPAGLCKQKQRAGAVFVSYTLRFPGAFFTLRVMR